MRSAIKKVALTLLGVLLLPGALAHAAGLGRISVQTALGQPLRAEIDIVSLQPGEAETLQAGLASVDAYRQANVQLTSTLAALRFNIERKPSGQYVVAVTSAQPINEPFIDMLVEIASANGRLVREYTFLLDPPEYRGPTVASAAPAVTPPEVKPLPTPAVQPAVPAVVAPAPAAPAAATPSVTSKPAANTHEVRRGDTLARIARQYQPEGVSLQQMLVALYRANEDAFIGNNMNRLRAGRILNVPDREQALATGAADATRMVNAQAADYAEYRRSVGDAVAAAPARSEGGRQASGKIAPPAPEMAAPTAPAPKDELRLSRPDDKGGKAGGAARADDVAARDKALRDAQERIAQLEKNIEDLKKLAAVKSDAGTQLQAQAAKAVAKPEAPKPEVPKAEPPKPEASKPEAAKADEPAKAPETPATPAAAAPDAAKPAPPKPASKPAAPPPEPPSFVDELLGDPVLTLGGAGGVIILLAGYAAYAWRRKKRLAQAEAAGASLMSAEPADALAMGGMAAARSIDTAKGGPSVQSDFADSGPGQIDTEEIDPVAEADVYMAYGRDVQAEEILKEALAKDSSRVPAWSKLLEIYANRKDRSAFESAALQLKSVTGGEGADWEKALALGLSIDPENGLYGGSGAAPSSADAALDLSSPAALAAGAPDIDLAADAGAGAPALDFELDVAPGGTVDVVAATPEETAAPALDFDLGLDEPAADAPARAGEPVAAPAEAGDSNLMEFSPVEPPAVDAPVAEVPPAADGGMTLDFDLGMGGATEEEKAAVAPAEVPAAPPDAAAADGNMISFDLTLPGGDVPTASAASAEPVAPLDLSALTLDLGSPGEGAPAAPDGKWQEVATKLDLAKAYRDMDNKDGARELLAEVLKEGDAAQQEEARSLMESLG